METLTIESAPPSSAVEKTGKKKLVLVGNPNVGKSLFFNHFSGLYVDVSNFPGTTVEITEGSYKNFRVIDTPGIYGVSSFNDEERVARDEVLSADVVLNVIDATNLERDLFLTLQLIDMQFPMVVGLNMMDAVEENGMEIDVARLSEILGVPIVKVTAVKKKGFDELEKALENATVGNADKTLLHQLEPILARLKQTPNPIADAVMILEGDETVAERHGIAPEDKREEIYVARRNRVNEIVAEVMREKSAMKIGAVISEKLGKWTINPISGIPILILALWLIYEVVGVMVAQRVVGHTEVELGNKLFEPFVKHLFATITPVEISVDVLNGEEVIETKSFVFPEGTSHDKDRFNEFKAFIEGKDVMQ
ncbi:MAG: FeoB small GTPase domain-containing protein, partial [Chloroherpetonaceae bacterium]